MSEQDQNGQELPERSSTDVGHTMARAGLSFIPVIGGAAAEIFNWFKGDFTQQGSVVDYLNKYADVEINKKAKVSFLNYNWGLNGK